MKPLVIALAVALTAAATARADFHGACTPSGTAGVGLSQTAGTFTFTGEVVCGGATAIEITSVRITLPDGTTADAPPSSCQNCGRAATSGTVPAATGRSTVRMVFTVRAGTSTFQNRSRTAQFDFGGEGQPVRVSGSGPAPPSFATCTPAGGAETFFTPAEAPATTATWGGRVRCFGAKRVLVTRAELRAPDGTVQKIAALPSCVELNCELELHVAATTTNRGPGSYVVTFGGGAELADGRIFNFTVTKSSTWLGIGPVLPDLPALPLPQIGAV